MTTIKLIEHGKNLTARVLGIKIKDLAIKRLISEGEILVFDFTGVNSMSTGFAKELFGELALSLGKDFPKKIRFDFGENRDIFLSAVSRGIQASVSKNSLESTNV